MSSLLVAASISVSRESTSTWPMTLLGHICSVLTYFRTVTEISSLMSTRIMKGNLELSP